MYCLVSNIFILWIVCPNRPKIDLKLYVKKMPLIGNYERLFLWEIKVLIQNNLKKKTDKQNDEWLHFFLLAPSHPSTFQFLLSRRAVTLLSILEIKLYPQHLKE